MPGAAGIAWQLEDALLPWPPDTDAPLADAVLDSPPATVVSNVVAELKNPPRIDAKEPLAVFSSTRYPMPCSRTRPARPARR